jgi:hypothetical protein
MQGCFDSYVHPGRMSSDPRDVELLEDQDRWFFRVVPEFRQARNCRIEVNRDGFDADWEPLPGEHAGRWMPIYANSIFSINPEHLAGYKEFRIAFDAPSSDSKYVEFTTDPTFEVVFRIDDRPDVTNGDCPS